MSGRTIRLLSLAWMKKFSVRFVLFAGPALLVAISVGSSCVSTARAEDLPLVDVPRADVPLADVPRLEAPPAVAPAAASLIPPAVPPLPVNTDMAVPAAAQESLARLMRAEILESLKGQYQGSDDWGQTTEAFHGIKIEGKGLKLKFRARKKEVRHGLWKKYEAEFVDPHQHLQVRLANLRPDGPGQLAGQIFLDARVRGTTRVERWRQGVKLLNFKAEADSRVEVRLDFTLAVKFVPTRFLADVMVEPKVTGVGLRLIEFDLKRVSKIDGWLAHELGDNLRGTIQRELTRREPKIADKVNLAIAEKQDRLRFSPDEMLSSRFGQIREAVVESPTK